MVSLRRSVTTPPSTPCGNFMAFARRSPNCCSCATKSSSDDSAVSIALGDPGGSPSIVETLARGPGGARVGRTAPRLASWDLGRSGRLGVEDASGGSAKVRLLPRLPHPRDFAGAVGRLLSPTSGGWAAGDTQLRTGGGARDSGVVAANACGTGDLEESIATLSVMVNISRNQFIYHKIPSCQKLMK